MEILSLLREQVSTKYATYSSQICLNYSCMPLLLLTLILPAMLRHGGRLLCYCYQDQSQMFQCHLAHSDLVVQEPHYQSRQLQGLHDNTPQQPLLRPQRLRSGFGLEYLLQRFSYLAEWSRSGGNHEATAHFKYVGGALHD